MQSLFICVYVHTLFISLTSLPTASASNVQYIEMDMLSPEPKLCQYLPNIHFQPHLHSKDNSRYRLKEVVNVCVLPLPPNPGLTGMHIAMASTVLNGQCYT